MINRCKACDLPFHPLTKNCLYCSKCKGKISYYDKKELVEKICKTCGKPFLTNKKVQVYCKAKCRNLADKRRKPKHEVICSNCGKPFETGNKIKKFCNDKCYRENKAKESRNEYKLSKPVKQ